MPKTLAKLKDLAGRAGKWLGLSAPAAVPAPTSAIAADRFDAMTWQEITGQAAALRELIEELGERHDYAADLVRDIFLAAYKAAPELHDRAQMDPSRLVNHQIVSALLSSPEFTDLRRETVGDPYAAAMAVLASAAKLREMTEQARQAQEAADAAAAARDQAEQAGQAVQEAMQQAGDQAGPDGTVPDDAAAAAEQAIAQAGQADQNAAEAAQAVEKAVDGIAAALRAAARQAADAAAGEAKEEADLMAAWGVEPGQLQRMPFDQRRRLAERLRQGRLGRYALLIGRFRTMASAERARKVEHAPGELTGIELSDDLSRLIPSEVAALGIPAMRAAFAARLAENRLFTYATRGDERVGLGAIIAVIDSSGSMAKLRANGMTREAWAKACALALLDQARAGRRDFVGILFSSKEQIKVFRFPGGQAPIDDVLDFAEFFFNGGTNFEVPLRTAVDLLEAEYNDAGKRHGDIVFVSDGECAVSEEWMRDWNDRKSALAFRAFGLAMGRQPGPVMTAVCDNVRPIEDLTDPGPTRDIFRVT